MSIDRKILGSIDSFGFENRSIDCTSAENWILQKHNQSSVQTQKQFKAEPKPLMHRIYNMNRIKLDKILNTSQTTVCNPRQRRQKLVAIPTDDLKIGIWFYTLSVFTTTWILIFLTTRNSTRLCSIVLRRVSYHKDWKVVQVMKYLKRYLI
jgi:hypothetical protein